MNGQDSVLARIDERLTHIALQMDDLKKHIDQLYTDTRSSGSQLSDYKSENNLRIASIEARIAKQEALGDFQRKLSFGLYMAMAAALCSGIGYLIIQ